MFRLSLKEWLSMRKPSDTPWSASPAIWRELSNVNKMGLFEYPWREDDG